MFSHRLLLLAETFPPSLGGVQSYLSGLWGALPAQTSFVVAASAPGDQRWDRQQSYGITRAPASGWMLPRWRKFYSAARHVVQEKKVEALVCGKALFEGRAARKLQAEFHLPYVVCTYGMEISTWLNMGKTRKDLLEVLRHAVRVIVINQQTKQQLLDVGVEERQLVKLYPGIAEFFFLRPRNPESLRTRLQLESKRVLVAVARLVPRKGHENLLRAFALVSQAVSETVLLIIGDGPERERLESMAKTLRIAEAVRFVGAVGDEDVIAAIDLCDCMVLTPRDEAGQIEGFGMVYMEASARGKTSVGSRVGGIPEAILDGETGLLVPPDSPAAAAEALLRLLKDEGLRNRLAATAEARAKKEFHWKGRGVLFQGMVHAMLTETP